MSSTLSRSGHYIRSSSILMSWPDDIDLGSGLDDIGIGSVHPRDTLISTNLV